MNIAQSLVSELDQEAASTRRMLEVVPEGRSAWKPHARSFSLGELSLHLAHLLSWTPETMRTIEFEMSPKDGPAISPPVYESMEATLRMFDENVATARDALAAASDADYEQIWTLKNGGQTIFSMPRFAVVRSFVLNHLVHHRGQLSVYLRMNDVRLPPVYGNTADDRG
jgi:uncharacterized damage-inducible protein DinB